MAWLVLSYPKLTTNDDNLIQQFRSIYDDLYFQAVDPHLTLVFPVFDIPEEIFIKEVQTKTEHQAKINCG